jgi:hypothetical protein
MIRGPGYGRWVGRWVVRVAVHPVVSIGILLALGLGGVAEGQSLRDPVPGDVYKEYAVVAPAPVENPDDIALDASSGPSYSGRAPENSSVSLVIDDLKHAKRAETIIELAANSNAPSIQIALNQKNVWTRTSGLKASATRSDSNVAVPVSLATLRDGVNDVQTWVKPPASDSVADQEPRETVFEWAPWSLLLTRVHYDPKQKPHASARIAMNDCETLGERPVIRVEASSPVGISRVDVFAFYQGFDQAGSSSSSGRYHHSYHVPLSVRYDDAGQVQQYARNVPVSSHVGTATRAPFEVVWDTSLVPDQSRGDVRLIARVRDNNGVWFVTDEVRGLSLQREEQSKRLYNASSTPTDVLRADDDFGQAAASVNVRLPDSFDPAQVESVKLLVATYGGDDLDSIGVNQGAVRVPIAFGETDQFHFDSLRVDPATLRAGNNVLTFSTSARLGGVGLLKPGPALLVTYRTANRAGRTASTKASWMQCLAYKYAPTRTRQPPPSSMLRAGFAPSGGWSDSISPWVFGLLGLVMWGRRHKPRARK